MFRVTDLKRLWANIDGVTGVEYGLIAALIAIASLTALTGTAGEVATMWDSIADKATNS